MQIVDRETFIREIQEPDGFMVLIEDFTNGCYELHVYRFKGMDIYQSPVVYDMTPLEAARFVGDVLVTAMRRPSDQIRMYQW
jgi:hypothetical protein